MSPGPFDVSGLEGLDFGDLRALDLAYVWMKESGAPLLARAGLDRVVSLDLRHSGVGDAGVAALVEQGRLGALRELHLQRCQIGAEGAAALARAPWKLTSLDLRDNPIGPEGARALASAPFMATLESLVLYKNDVTSEGARALGACEALKPTLRNYWRAIR